MDGLRRLLALLGAAFLLGKSTSTKFMPISSKISEQLRGSEDAYRELIVTVWSKAVDTQMHFNEMSVKSRQLGLTFVAAALGLAVFLFSRSGSESSFSIGIAIHGHTYFVHVAALIVAAAAVAVGAVRTLDLGVYHKMLRGAVTFGEDLERRHFHSLFELNLGMTEAVSHFSRFSDASVGRDLIGRNVYRGKVKKNAEQKIRRFYNLVIWFLSIAALALLVIDNLRAH